MSEMVERVAKAAYGALLDDPERNTWPESHFSVSADIFRDCARAAIQAMREPTLPMIAAGDSCPIVNYDGNDPREVWQTMIDAALEERL